MIRTRDPRIRQRINQISHNLESANETAQEGLYTFSHNYISPCLASIGNCVQACTAPCLPSREEHLRRRRRGRAEANFDFYDDWENEEADDSLLGWGTGELDRLLAGSGLTRGGAEQPRRQRRMSYGTRNTRRRSTVHIPDNRADPTVIPSSSLIGFLERFPWRFGAKGVKYRPSAADLQEHPGSTRFLAQENEPLMEAAEDDCGPISYQNNGRNRSGTQSSRGTSNSLSSRGDLFPSDEEEDAVPLDDEFALVFGRRSTGLESDDQSGTKPEMVRSASGTSSLGDASSKKSKRKKKKKRSSTKSAISSDPDLIHSLDTPSIADLKIEDDRAAREEESVIERKRLAAHELALKRGLDSGTTDTMSTPLDSKIQATGLSPTQSPSGGHTRQSSNSSGQRFTSEQIEPFPSFPLQQSSLPGSPGVTAASPRPSSLNDPDPSHGPSHYDGNTPH
ncbi:hypothetical protein N7462_008512 [Penicillium macrosclerotiorum]|uniref:uncharacterized protein n=1 Tax=Penicillium macrosclerotiorum TaxID=303699 RepID=UPI0025466D54|nr:uncharacterized protein N7462_008512 [Penicillium macrosclerotiorum]KAJ5675615.1 hypothetical protein N7462_008512 [Penicillium macrosclerotiorum]